jgi:phage tail-like protein
MTEFRVNPRRRDPYKNFKFRVKWDGRYVAGVTNIGGLHRTIEAVRNRGSGSPIANAKSPDRSGHGAITFERGLTHDAEFERWASNMANSGSGRHPAASLDDFRKEVIVELYNEAGQLAMTYKLSRCWVSEFQALPELDGNANAVAIQRLKLEHDGWERMDSPG